MLDESAGGRLVVAYLAKILIFKQITTLELQDF